MPTATPARAELQPGLWGAADYKGSFQYRYEGRAEKQGSPPPFADPRHDDGGWQSATGIGKPPGRGPATVLWLRTRLTGPPLRNPMLYLRLSSHTADLYLDGHPVTPYMSTQTLTDFLVSVRDEYLLPLTPDYAGKTLVLRISSAAPMIGITATPRLGEASAVTLDFVRSASDQGLVALLFLAVAAVSAVLFALRHTQRAYLYFAIYCGSIGIYDLTLSGALGVLVPWPFPRLPSQILSLTLACAAICSYVSSILDSGPLRILRWVRMTLLAHLALSAAVTILDPPRLILLIQPINILTGVLLVSLIITVARAARRGNVDAKILSLGFTVVLGLVMPDILVATGVVSGKFGSNFNVALLVLALTLAVILLRRFVADHIRSVQLQFENTLAHKRLSEQEALLHAAARMAKGDLETKITVEDKSPLAPLAVALEQMRQDLQSQVELLHRMQRDLRAQVGTLETRNQEIVHLNEELRRQIEQRSRRLLDLYLPSSGTPQRPSELAPGDLLGDYYRIVRTIGQGGMGTVYQVERITDGRQLAAKVLRSAAVDRTALGRFAREAQIMARLSHPSLVAISDVDVTTQGVLYLIMELVSGSSLWQRRERYGDIAWNRALLAQIADALAALHTCGVVHRDLKPENVMVIDGEGGRPLVKLADFGISLLLEENRPNSAAAAQPSDAQLAALLPRAEPGREQMEPTLEALRTSASAQGQSNPLHPAGSDLPADSRRPSSGNERALTQTGVIMGTPVYMAPELLQGSRHAQPAADVFSLGVLAFEMFTGRPPFLQPPILMRSLGAELVVPPLLRNRPGLDPVVVTLIESCLATNPESRPSAQQLASALRSSLSA